MNKIWVLIWYGLAMIFGMFIAMAFNKIIDLYLRHKEKQLRRKMARYKKYGRIYRYEGIFRELI